ncbi:MAG TPA: hypothetical protein DDY39_20210 [Nitrospira sp.]|nr:hypothetical protein [Nitrospira sp.]
MTNREGNGLTLICVHQEKAGTVKLVHHAQKNELVAAGYRAGNLVPTPLGAGATCSPTICSAR